MSKSDRTPYAVSSADNVLRLLLHLARRQQLRVTEAAGYLSVGVSTAHRLLQALVRQDLARQLPGETVYRPGAAMLTLGRPRGTEQQFRDTARPFLEELRSRVKETVHLVILDGRTARFLDGLEGPQRVRVGLRTGAVVPAYTSAGGKVLLAELDPADVRRLFPDEFITQTEHTLPDVDALLAELRQISDLGYATNLEESEIGLAAVGVCVRDLGGLAIGAVTTSGPAARVQGRLDEIVAALVDIGASFADALGQAPRNQENEPQEAT